MGWKNVKDRFAISHHVQLRDAKICIGSGYVHDLAAIEPETGVVIENSTFKGFLQKNYPALLSAPPKELSQLIASSDIFSASNVVYTYDGGEIIEKKCETFGWPHVTHDGIMMYENTFSPDLSIVVAWAKRNADLGVKFCSDQIREAEQKLADCKAKLCGEIADREKLEATYPEISAALTA